MKSKIWTVSAIAFTLVATSCIRKENARYVDLSSGEKVELVKDEETGLMVHADTRKPVYMYVDTRTNDTIYGSTGKVVNGQVRRTDDGSWQYTGDYKYKNDDEDVKIKVEDGEYKYKSGDVKIKIDEDGKKVKRD